MAVVPITTYNSMKQQADASFGRMRSAQEELLAEKRKLLRLTQESGGMSKEDLQAMQTKFDAANEQIQEELDSLREEFGRQLGKQAQEYKRALTEIRSLAEGNKHDLDSLNNRISSLETSVKSQFDVLAKRMQNNRKQSLYYYQQLKETVDQIEKLFPEKYEVLFPDQLQPGSYVLRSALDSVLEDIGLGRYEAAIGLSQTYLPEAINTLGLLEFFHAAFLKAEKDTKKALSDLLARVEKLEKPKKTVLHIGKDVEYEDNHGIGYWARELFGEIRQRLSDANARFDICADAHDEKGLTLIHQDIDVLNGQISACEQIEESERRLHYECCERAAQVIDILDANDDNAWYVEEYHINEEDLRDPVYMTLARPEGYRVTVACYQERGISQTEPSTVRCELEVFDNGIEKADAGRCCTIYRNIATILATHGIVLDSEIGNETQSANSKSFIRNAIDHEGQARTRWLSAAKKAIGLFVEVKEWV